MRSFSEFVTEAEKRAEEKFKKGDSVVDHTGRHYAKITDVNHPMVHTNKGMFHHTKVKKYT